MIDADIAWGFGRDGVLFSEHVLDAFGGRGAAMRDFGGFLMEFSAFLDQDTPHGPLLEASRRVRFQDLEHVRVSNGVRYLEPSTTVKAPERRVYSAHDKQVMGDVSLSHSKAARIVGTSEGAVRWWRRQHAVQVDWSKALRRNEAVDWDSDKIVALLRSDVPHMRLAKQLGVCVDTVRTRRLAIGVDRRGIVVKNTALDWEDPAVKALVESNATSKDVAVRLGVSTSTVKRRRGRRNVRRLVDWNDPNIAGLLASDLPTPVVAERLGVTPRAVRKHRALDRRDTMRGHEDR